MILIVKSSLARITPIAGTIVCLSALLCGCGQPGPLYLPKTPAKPATSKELAPPAAATPAAAAPASSTPASQK